MRFFRRNSATHYSLHRGLFLAMLIVVYYFFSGSPFVFVLMYAHLFSPFEFLLILTLSSIWLVVLGVAVVRPSLLRAERAIMGDEAFFASHPKEYRKELARWRKVSAFINGTMNSDIELLPGLLQLKRELSDEDAARLGVCMTKSFSGISDENELEFNCEKYDRIYYSRHPRMLEHELRMLNIKRALFLLFKNHTMPTSPYEARLCELKSDFPTGKTREAKRNSKRKPYNDYSFIGTLIKYLLMFFSIACIGFPYGYVVIHAHALNTPVYILLKLLTLSLVPIFAGIVSRPMLLRAERAFFGDEMFFKKHPREYHRELARWRKVSAFTNGAMNSDIELLPGLLQMKRELSDDDAARFGVCTTVPSGSLPVENEPEFDIEKYDRIYYSRHPRMLEYELRMLNIKRGFCLIFRNTDIPQSPYEQRLNELKEEFAA